MAEFDRNMNFPELDEYFSKGYDVADKSSVLASLLQRGAAAYRGKEELREQCLKARELLPKEYRNIKFAKLPKLIEKCRTLDLKSYYRELIKCLIIAVCFYTLFQSIVNSTAIFMLCFIVLVGVGYLTDRKIAEKLETYYSLSKQLRSVFPELELEEDYCSEEILMSLYDIVQANELTSLESAVEKLKAVN